MNINVTAILKSLPGKSDEMKAVLLQLVAGSTQESACIQYDLHQAADEPNLFIFHEIWQDAENWSSTITRRMYLNLRQIQRLY